MRFCRGQGLIRGEWLAIDGSKFEAVASRKAVLSRERLLREQAALDRRVAEYLERLDAADAEEGETKLDAGAVREALEQPTLNIVADAGYSNGAQADALPGRQDAATQAVAAG